MQRLKQILLILILGGLLSLLCVQMNSTFAVEKETLYSTLGNKVVCPVMGTLFNITEESEKSVYQGKFYYFCCPGCKAPFEKNPEGYFTE